MPCGSISPTVCRSVPPLPEVSMPCSTSSTRRRGVQRCRSAKSRSWRSASSSPIAASAFLPSAFLPSNPGAASVSIAVRSTGPVGSGGTRGMRSSCRHQASTRRTSRVQPTIVPVVPSAWGSSNQRPRVKPALSSTRSDASLRWSGAAKYDVASRQPVAGPHHPRPQDPHAVPATDPGGLADRVVDADGVRVGREQGVVGVVADPVVLEEADRPAVDLGDPHPGRASSRRCPGRTAR